MYHDDLITPAAEIHHRIATLQQKLRRDQIDGALILQKADLFYFAGTVQQAHLYIPAQGEALLMVYKEFTRAKSESALKRIVALPRPGSIPGLLQDHGLGLPQRLGLELDVLPTTLYFTYQKIFTSSRLDDISPAIRTVRSIKSPYEIEMIAAAAHKSDEVAAAVPGLVREGMREIELAALIEAEARKLGHQGLIRMRLWGNELFYGHIMAGPAAAVPSFISSPTGGIGAGPAIAQGSGFETVNRGEPILVDFVFALNGYLSDHARIFAFDGLPERLKLAHTCALEIQDLVQQAAKPGVEAGSLYDLSLAHAQKRGFADHFMGVGPQRIKFVGHGLGLELDEYPFLARGQNLRLQPGMTLAVEPKFVIPGLGVVGVENTFVVGADGLEKLGRFNEDINLI